MPTGYTDPVRSGEITELKDFAAKCAPAFSAFIHLRDDADKTLRYPKADTEFVAEQLAKALKERSRWRDSSEEEKYAEWSEYYVGRLAEYQRDKARRASEEARYRNMLAQVVSLDVDSRLSNFKNFMIEQLESSIEFDCSPTDWYKPVEYVEWVKARYESVEDDVVYFNKKAKEAYERHEERIEYINLMAETFGFEITDS